MTFTYFQSFIFTLADGEAMTEAAPDETRAVAATPSAELERQIMSSLEGKNEREWWAAREIEKLRDKLATLTAERDAAREQARDWEHAYLEARKPVRAALSGEP